MNEQKIIIRNLASTAFKVFIPLALIVFFLFPMFYYFSLIWFSGISRHYDSYFEVQGENKIVFLKKKPASWITIKEVNNAALWPIVVSEDWGFYQHGGVDWEQLRIVLEDAVKKFSIKRGASTITQQVIKNLFLSDERSFVRKFHEIILAYYLENKVPKKWILEQYINLAEFDKNVYGLKKASQHFFKKHPSKLRYKEGAFLAMLLPSPKKYSISYYKGALTPYAGKTVARILGKLVIAKIITKDQMYDELQTPLYWEKSVDAIGYDVLDSVINEIKSGVESKIEEDSENVSTQQTQSSSVETPTPEIITPTQSASTIESDLNEEETNTEEPLE